jgi:hypothetical protein
MNFLRLDDRTSVRDLVTIQRDKLRGVKVDSGRVDLWKTLSKYL